MTLRWEHFPCFVCPLLRFSAPVWNVLGCFLQSIVEYLLVWFYDVFVVSLFDVGVALYRVKVEGVVRGHDFEVVYFVFVWGGFGVVSCTVFGGLL